MNKRLAFLSTCQITYLLPTKPGVVLRKQSRYLIRQVIHAKDKCECKIDIEHDQYLDDA